MLVLYTVGTHAHAHIQPLSRHVHMQIPGHNPTRDFQNNWRDHVLYTHNMYPAFIPFPQLFFPKSLLNLVTTTGHSVNTKPRGFRRRSVSVDTSRLRTEQKIPSSSHLMNK